MSDSFWKPDEEQRRMILLLEATGLLHDLGKLSDGFLKKEANAEPGFSYDYRLLADPKTVFPPTATGPSKRLDKMRKNAGDARSGAPFKDRPDLTVIFQGYTFQGWDAHSYSLAEILLAQFAAQELKALAGKDFAPAKLLRHLHGVAHFEKEDPGGGANAKGDQPPFSAMHRASPFGFETHIPVDAPGSDLTSALRHLPLTDLPKIHTAQRRQWLADLREHLAKGIADTRRPTNEVSLWDWGYTVATMTKAAAAWVFRNGWPAQLEDLAWRTLRINLNRLEVYARSDKITDLLGTHEAIDDAFTKVRVLLEETYALCNCFYQDETGVYYLFPDINGSEKEMAALRKQIQSQFPADLCPRVHFGGRITAAQLDPYTEKGRACDRNALRHLVATPRQAALNEAPVGSDNNLNLYNCEWAVNRPENAEICTVCGVRPVGGASPGTEPDMAPWATRKKAEQRKVCRVCLDRRGRRSKHWVEKGFGGTIWTNEVADANGRLALFVGKLGLEGWLDGSLLETIAVANGKSKNPSPARLYRIAETSRAFWELVRDKITPHVVGSRAYRLALYPAKGEIPDLGDSHVYELNVDGLALSAVWDHREQGSRLVTAENLSYFIRRWMLNTGEYQNANEGPLSQRIEKSTFNVVEPSEFALPGRRLGRVRIEKVEKLCGYQPAIPLLAEPGLCMTLVPADKALPLARAVRDEYVRQMGRIRDRLPLGIGLVFAKRGMPVRALLEAGRAMLEMISEDKWEGWRLMTKDDTSDPALCELRFENGIVWRVPVTAGDSETTDNWYPRLYVGKDRADSQPMHAKDLDPQVLEAQGQRVWLQPSRFDFEFLDTTGRRFEIDYGREGRRERRTRPFYLDDLDRMDKCWQYFKCLSKSQRRQVIHAIEATREIWFGGGAHYEAGREDAEVFRNFVADTLALAAWPDNMPWHGIDPAWRETLIRFGESGELTDLAELHMEILKE